MVALKTSEIDRYLARPDQLRRVILIHGRDTGLVMERAEALARATGVDLGDPFATIRLDADEVAADRGRLADEAFTVGMFGGERLIRVSGSTRRNLADAVKPVVDSPPSDAWIIIEAGELDSRSALRKLFEKAQTATAIACYQDDDKALEQLIAQEIRDAGLQIDHESVIHLKSLLGNDRMASRNELRKLALYCGDSGTVSIDDINAIVSDASAFSANDVIDAAACGDLASLEDNFQRVLDEGLSADMLLVFALRHFQLLHETKSMMLERRMGAASAVGAMKPPVYFKRRNRIVEALDSFSLDSMSQQLDRLEHSSFEARRNPLLGRSIAGTALLAIALTARRSRSHRS